MQNNETEIVIDDNPKKRGKLVAGIAAILFLAVLIATIVLVAFNTKDKISQKPPVLAAPRLEVSTSTIDDAMVGDKITFSVSASHDNQAVLFEYKWYIDVDSDAENWDDKEIPDTSGKQTIQVDAQFTGDQDAFYVTARVRGWIELNGQTSFSQWVHQDTKIELQDNTVNIEVGNGLERTRTAGWWLDNNAFVDNEYTVDDSDKSATIKPGTHFVNLGQGLKDATAFAIALDNPLKNDGDIFTFVLHFNDENQAWNSELVVQLAQVDQKYYVYIVDNDNKDNGWAESASETKAKGNTELTLQNSFDIKFSKQDNDNFDINISDTIFDAKIPTTDSTLNPHSLRTLQLIDQHENGASGFTNVDLKMSSLTFFR